MAITQMENFGGLRQGIALQAMPAGQVGLPAARIVNGSSFFNANGCVVEKVDNKCWLGGITIQSLVNYVNAYTLDLSRLVLPATNNFVIGYRQKRKTATAALPINLTVGGTSADGANGQLTQAMATLAIGVAEWYVELEFDRAAKTISMYIDGKFISTYTTSGSTAAALIANTLFVQIPIGSTQGIYVTDIYVVEDTKDNTPNGRLGPQDIWDVPLQLSDNEGWDVTNLADVLGRKDYDADTGKYLVGSGADSELKLVVADDYALPYITQVNGLAIQGRGSYAPGKPGDIDVKLTRGTHTLEATVTQNNAISLADLGIRMFNQSIDPAEADPATALNGLEISLTVAGR